jgi:hypothetical protein
MSANVGFCPGALQYKINEVETAVWACKCSYISAKIDAIQVSAGGASGSLLALMPWPLVAGRCGQHEHAAPRRSRQEGRRRGGGGARNSLGGSELREVVGGGMGRAAVQWPWPRRATERTERRWVHERPYYALHPT